MKLYDLQLIIFGRMPDHIHTPLDGRGNRNVYLNGRLIKRAFYADTKKGILKHYTSPPRIDHTGERIHWLVKHGLIEVQPAYTTRKIRKHQRRKINNGYSR